MTYSTIGILAIIIHFIINKDVLWERNANANASRVNYRHFLVGVLVYYVTDVLWGILDDYKLTQIQYADTVIYFLSMAVAVLLWTRYVVSYLEDRNAFGRLLIRVGQVFVAFEAVVVAANFIWPILFWFDEAGAYHAGAARYVTLGIQILMFLLASAYTLSVTTRSEGAVKQRHRTIGLFGIAMIFMIAFQVLYPLLPMYAMGYMIGVCLLHTFVVEGEKEEYRRRLEETLKREQLQRQELGSAKRLAYTDPLTGVKSKHACIEAEKRLDERIAAGEVREFGIVVFDLNGLKEINDTRGHETGDAYIIEACRLICKTFKHSPVFRIGGDEFVALLEGEDYERRREILAGFDAKIEENLRADRTVASSGMAEYRAGQDASYRAVFDRADVAMYERKKYLKRLGAEVRA